MKMIRFKEDIPGEYGLVWQKGNIYKILSEGDEQIVIESDAVDNETYTVNRSDLGTYCFAYVCNGIINANCKYCRYLCTYNGDDFCENVRRSDSGEQGLLQGSASDYSETV